jgi:polyketide cyclase/dehydrase/lipid transport protein
MSSGKDMGDGVATKVASGLGGAAKGLVSAAGKRLLSKAGERMGGVTERLTDFATNGGGGSGLLSAITGGGGGGGGDGGGGKGGGKDKSLKVTNIVEHIDVGVPVRLAYNQWTQFGDFPSFMKKVESVEQDGDEKLKWRAQILWSHRSWQSTIVEQVPDRRIVWKSKGDKGFVDGAVTFHELAPELTRILVILQYHPKGFFEHTGNLWRAQGRRARLELKHFARHVMTDAVLRQDEIEGWRGEIHDGQVVRSHEDAIEQEQQHQRGEGEAPEQDERVSRQGERATGGEREPSGQRGRSGPRASTSDDQGDRRRQRPPRRSDDREPGRSTRGRAGSER